MQFLIPELKKLIIDAGSIALSKKKLGFDIWTKSDSSPVTSADKEISDFIYAGLKAIAPEIQVICEERELVALNSDSFWLIDPIDGTKSYIKGEDTYSVNIAFIEKLIPKIGLIYLPSIGKLYYSDYDQNFKIEENGIELPIPPYQNKEPVAMVSCNHSNDETASFLKNHNFNNIIKLPSSIKLCLIAANSADIYPKLSKTMEWDIAAGHALIMSMGGNIIDMNGNRITYGKKNFENPNFLACNKLLLSKILSELSL